MDARKQFTPEFKREAVQLLESGSRPASALARELAFGAINSTSGSGNSRLVGPGRFLDRGRGRSEPLRWPG
jgi:hypothetical protein